VRILMVSPHPTYSPRGTPISVLNRCRALCALGHEVDLVTYGIGEDVTVPGLRYLRAPVPGIRTVKVGPSPAKIPLDLAVFGRTAWLLARARSRYDVLHTHEEAGALGAVVRRPSRLPHVYDMGNDLSVVMTNYGYSPSHVATRLVGRVEAGVVSRADVVVAHFPSIADRVLAITGDPARAVVVPNIALDAAPDSELTETLRRRWSFDGLPVALYTGTLEDYQGLPMMVSAIADLVARGVAVRLVIVGGRTDQQASLRGLADRSDLGDRVLVAGSLPAETVPSALRAADVLVSPRASGSNTPLKLFSYIASGRPVLATDIESHSQILDSNCAELVTPDAEGLAAGLERLLAAPEVARKMAVAAQAVSDRDYSIAEYVRRVAQAYAAVGGTTPNAAELDEAVDRLRAQLSPAGSTPAPSTVPGLLHEGEPA
jgi:glycosyltransferase involved in cell wall biosynthesis